jgi:8-oxo-dGTP pyrophosphatase MutT (NUDIX family)
MNTPSQDAPLQIAVAALLRQGAAGPEVLIARRHDSAIRGGLWELPGGKADPDEGPVAAACRELAEETGVVVPPGIGRAIGSVDQHDPHLPTERRLTLTLVVFDAPPDASPRALAAAECRWDRVDRLDGYAWPEANRTLNAMLASHARAWRPGPAHR